MRITSFFGARNGRLLADNKKGQDKPGLFLFVCGFHLSIEYFFYIDFRPMLDRPCF